MRRRPVLLAAALAAAVTLEARDATSPDFKGRLAKAFYFMSPDVSNALKALTADTSGDVSERLSAAAARVTRLPDGVHDALGNSQERGRRRGMVLGMLALTPLLPTDTAIELAATAAREAPFEAEAGCDRVNAAPDASCDRTYTLVQAHWAETYLKQHRDTPLTPYLYGYLMTRYRLAYEYATKADDIDARKTAARKYRAFLLRARSLTEPLARWVIDDIDRMPHVEAATKIHPRDYDPDACCNGRKGE